MCGWCSYEEFCSGMSEPFEDCSTSFTIFTDFCPLPVINSVDPNRGPVEGGTRIKITGSNLGAAFSDIVQVWLVGPTNNVSCSLVGEEGGYVIGSQVTCETEKFSSTGEYTVEVEVQRESQTVYVVAMADFEVVQPVLSGVAPTFGPKSGGIEVAVSGSLLDIGNTEETRVELNGVNCGDVTLYETVLLVDVYINVFFKRINGSRLTCVSNAIIGNEMSISTGGPVQVFINNAIINMTGVDFEFQQDPVYAEVTPYKVIPA